MATYLDTEDKVLELEHVEKKQLAHRATDATEVNDLIHNPRTGAAGVLSINVSRLCDDSPPPADIQSVLLP
jgi:hypothetical protein